MSTPIPNILFLLLRPTYLHIKVVLPTQPFPKSRTITANHLLHSMLPLFILICMSTVHRPIIAKRELDVYNPTFLAPSYHYLFRCINISRLFIILEGPQIFSPFLDCSSPLATIPSFLHSFVPCFLVLVFFLSFHASWHSNLPGPSFQQTRDCIPRSHRRLIATLSPFQAFLLP